MAASSEIYSSERVNWWRDERYRALFYQFLTFVGLIGLIAILGYNAWLNLQAKDPPLYFGFFDQIAGFDVSFHLLPYSMASSTYLDVAIIGLLNTLLVSVLGVIAATIIGFLLGVMRLSRNWLISKLAYCYVDLVRNVPLLLQIFIWAAVFLYLPVVREASHVFGIIYVSNRGVELPTPNAGDLLWVTAAAFVVAIIASIIIGRWAKARQMATGEFFPSGLVGLALIVGLPVVAFLVTGLPLDFTLPELKGFNFVGGINIPPSFIALWLALTFYTAAFIAEIVRAGIQAVSHGQTEAAYSLGFRPGRTLRLIIIPQALRVIVPPLTSQYLNLTKNSSLGVAIAYPELVSVFAGTSLNQTGRAIEILSITMLIYLTISLSISMFMNWYNKRIALVER